MGGHGPQSTSHRQGGTCAAIEAELRYWQWFSTDIGTDSDWHAISVSLQWHRPALSTATVDGHKLPHHRREHVRPMARAARPEVSAAAVAAKPAIAQPTAAASAEPSVSIKRHAPAVDAQVAIAAAAQPAKAEPKVAVAAASAAAKAAEPQVATAAAAAAPQEESKVAAAALKPAAKADTAAATAAPAGPLAAPRRLMQAAFDAAWAVNALFNRH
jgi:hypothetical protein